MRDLIAQQQDLIDEMVANGHGSLLQPARANLTAMQSALRAGEEHLARLEREDLRRLGAPC